jgi:RNase P/RNase MRP subunit p29
MDELLGRNVKIVLNSSSGMIVISGEVIKIDDGFLLLSTSQGQMFVSLQSIKTIEFA